MEPAGPQLLSSGIGKNSEGELLLVTAGPVGGQALASNAHCMGRQYTSRSPSWQCPDRHSSVATDGHGTQQQGRLVELSHHWSEASSEPVPLLMSKDSSQHSTHPTQLGTQHRGSRAWGSQGAHELCPATGGTISTADSLLLPYRHPGCCPTVPPRQQHHLPRSTLQHTPAITYPARAGLRAPLPCSWAQHLPNTPTASDQFVSLLPSWHCSCHTPSWPPTCGATSSARAMAPQSTQPPGTLRSQRDILDS